MLSSNKFHHEILKHLIYNTNWKLMNISFQFLHYKSRFQLMVMDEKWIVVRRFVTTSATSMPLGVFCD
jgi:hypothetical protein